LCFSNVSLNHGTLTVAPLSSPIRGHSRPIRREGGREGEREREIEREGLNAQLVP